MKIANKISLSFLITAIILTSVAGSIFYTIAGNNLKKAIIEHLKTTARSRTNHIETLLEEHKQVVELMASGLIFQELFSTSKDTPKYNKILERTNSRINRVIEAHEEIFKVSLLDKNGTVVASTYEASVGSYKSADNMYLKVEETDYIRDMYISETFGTPAINIAGPVLLNGEILGFIFATLDAKKLFKITLDRTGLGETGEIYLINKDGYMISPSRFKEDVILKQKVGTINAKNCLTHKGEEHILGREEISVFPDYRGVNVLGTHEYIPEMRWGLLAEIDAKEVLAPLGRIRLILVLILIVVPIVAWLAGVYVSRIISGPIHKLHAGTEIIGKGNLDYKVATDSMDEIGQLSRAFDKMTEDLGKTTTSIDKLNKEIVERKRKEVDLKEKGEKLSKYKTYIDAMGDALIVLNMERKVIKLNKAAIQLLRYTEEDISHLYFETIFPEKEHGQHYAEMKTALDTGTVRPFESLVLTKNGEEIPVLFSGTALKDARNEPIGFIGVCRDITVHKRMEEASRKVAALETLNVILENFVSDALSNILTPIYGRIQLCGIRDNIDLIKSEIEVIEGEITKLLTGINAYREFCRLGERSLEKISSTDISYILGPLLSGQPLKTYGNENFPIDPGVKLRFVYDPKQEGALDWEGLPYVVGDES
ncbi:MAG: cache domain-containing protein, partial [Candidatus Bathyarchaeia archaeon]